MLRSCKATKLRLTFRAPAGSRPIRPSGSGGRSLRSPRLRPSSSPSLVTALTTSRIYTQNATFKLCQQSESRLLRLLILFSLLQNLSPYELFQLQTKHPLLQKLQKVYHQAIHFPFFCKNSIIQVPFSLYKSSLGFTFTFSSHIIHALHLKPLL